MGAPCSWVPGGWVPNGYVQAAIGRSRHPNLGLGTASVLADVGQRFLHDAVGVTTQGAGCGSGTVHLHLEVDLCAGPASLLHQAWNVSQRRLWHRRRPLLPWLLAEHAYHVPQLFQRLVGGQPQQRCALPHPGGRQVACDLQRTGVQRYQGDAVGEHVVHLPRNPGSLSQARTFSADHLIGLGPLRSFAQGGEELTPGADEHAPSGCGGHKRRRRQHDRPGTGPAEPDRAHHCGRNEQRGDEQCGPDMAVDSQRGQASRPATVPNVENAPNMTQTSATPNGQRRRHHNEIQHRTPNAASVATCPEVIRLAV